MLVKLEEHCDFIGGFAFKSQDLKETTGIPVVKIKNVNNKIVTLNDVQYFPENKLTDKLTKFLLDDGDVLIAMTGQGSVGRVGRFSNLSDNYALLNQRVGKFLPKDTLDLGYLFYVLSSNKYEKELFNAATGSGQPNLSPDIIKSIKIPFIPKNEQLRVSKFLGDLDKKIELNQQTNQTLEQMAQTLFKSWFVDFDPVFDNLLAKADFKIENLESTLPEELVKKAKTRLLALNDLTDAVQTKASLKALAQGLSPQSPEILPKHATTHAHFPNEFEHNEQLGWIPKDWRANNIGEFVDLSQGLAINAKSKYLLVDHGLPLLRITDLLNGTEIHFIDEKKVSQKCIASSSDIIFTRTGQVGLVYTNKKGVVHNNCFKVISKGDLLNKYIYWFLKRSEIYEYTNSVASGSVQKDLNHSAFKTIPIVCPGMEVQIKSEEYWEDLNRKMIENNKQIESLTKLRDTLLPKLISGELHIPDVKSES